MTVEVYDDHYQPRRFESFVVGFVGDPGVGSTSICRRLFDAEFLGQSPELTQVEKTVLQELGHIQSHPVSWLLREQGYRPPDKDTTDPGDMRAFHEELRARGEGATIFERLVPFTTGVHIVEKIRHPSDAGEIKSRGGFIIALVVDDPAISDERYLADATDAKHTNAPFSASRRAALEHAKTELDPENNSAYASDINSTKLLADETVDISDDIASSTERVMRALERLGLQYLETLPPKVPPPSKWVRNIARSET